MTDAQLKIIESNPIGEGLNTFRASFNSICDNAGVSRTPDALGQLDQEGIIIQLRALHFSDQHTDIQNLTIYLLLALQSLRASRLLPSSGSGKNLFSDLSSLNSAVNSDKYDFHRIKPLLNTALADHLNDALIWTRVYDAVTESTPPPRPIASSL